MAFAFGIADVPHEIDLLKINIEGSEDRALMPYLKSIQRDNWPDYIMLEVGNRSLWQEDCVDFLGANQYEVAFTNGENMHFRSTA